MSEQENLQKNVHEQVNSSVQWTKTIQYLESQEIELMIECGPGNILSGLNKKTSTIKTLSINSFETLNELRELTKLIST